MRICKAKIVKVILYIFSFFIFCSFFVNYSYAKYLLEYNFNVANINIDNNVPRFELVSVRTNNRYADKLISKKHTITIILDLYENNISFNKFNADKLIVYRDGREIYLLKASVNKISENKGKIRYEIKLFDIKGNGKLAFGVEKNVVGDLSGNVNREEYFDIGIFLDNVSPVISMSNSLKNDGKVLVKLHSNEKLVKNNNWYVNDNLIDMEKEFRSNVSYPFPIMDLAENESIININVTNATSIYTEFSVWNSYANYDLGVVGENNHIYGRDILSYNRENKIELITMHSSGDISDDYLQMQIYMYTSGGEGNIGYSSEFETKYNYGYNPLNGFGSLKNYSNLGRVNNKKSLILGGDNVNYDAITSNITNGKLLYGVSSLKLKLKDENDYSIIYQIYVNDIGWLPVKENGEEAVYKYNKPFSCFRYSIIPNTEKVYLKDYWNKDNGTKII